jgi:hypothetical protein
MRFFNHEAANNRNKVKFLLLFCLLGFFFFSPPGRAQTYLETFGQNRIQHRTFDWRYFDTEHFKVYHYDAAGRQLARYVAEQAEKDIRVIERKMGEKFPHRFNIILYNSYDDYQQNNIGRPPSSQVQDVPAGKVDLVGDKLVVYYTGVHTDVHRQLRAGMSRVVMERMLFGESLKQMVKNAVSMDLPLWITSGFIAYVVDGWDTESETEWKNYLEANPKKGFYELAEAKPEIAGKAFWKFVSYNYGEQNIKNLLYTMQMKSKLNKGLQMTIGMDIKHTFDSVIKFYNRIYQKDALVQEAPDSADNLLNIQAPDNQTLIRSIKVSPRGHDVAYVTWLNGEYNVYIQRTSGEQTKKAILSGGRKDFNAPTDPDYPILAWNNTGFKLAILYKRKQKNQTRLKIYDGLKSKMEDVVIPHNRFDRVLGMTFMEDDQLLVISAIKKGQTDLYEFRIKRSKLTQITNDVWDDVQPSFISGGARRGIVFLSNRPEANLKTIAKVNELPTGPMNAFFYDTKTKSPQLLQLTNIQNGNISQPIQYGSENFAYLYDTSGITNQYMVLFGRTVRNMDSAYSLPTTNYTNSIISHQYNAPKQQAAEVVQMGKSYKVYFHPLVIPGVNTTAKNLQPTTLSGSNNVGAVPMTEVPIFNTPTTQQTPAITTLQNAGDFNLQTGNVFQTEFANELSKKPSTTTASNEIDTSSIVQEEDTVSKIPELSTLTDEDSIKVDSTYVKLRAKTYRYSFKPDFVSFRLDNSILFNKYQPIGQNYAMPALGAMLTLSLNDVMENIRITGGLRLPINFTGMNYFLQYENVTRRVDWSVLLLRTENFQKVAVSYVDTNNSVLYTNPDQVQKTTSNLLQGSATYPFDRIRSIRMHLGIRQDIVTYKDQDPYALIAANVPKKYWILSRVEYIHDNTKNPTINIFNGLRMKIYGEYFYELSKPNGGLYNLGTDIRYYKPLYKNIIFATRLAYAHSGGNKKINYVMGGVDNWLFSKQAAFGPSASQNFGFQALATNLRGYEQNARSGNTFGVINAELRAPILTAILKRPIQNALLKNLQLVGFLDVGNAWNGWLPGDDDNSRLYSFPGRNNTVTVYLQPPSTGLAVGYGGGLRTMLFGYFMRLDAAWNIEGRTKPIFYFSLGTDF